MGADRIKRAAEHRVDNRVDLSVRCDALVATMPFFKTHILGCVAKGKGRPEGDAMTTLQAIALGAMLAWTPSLLFLAFVLWEKPLEEAD